MENKTIQNFEAFLKISSLFHRRRKVSISL